LIDSSDTNLVKTVKLIISDFIFSPASLFEPGYISQYSNWLWAGRLGFDSQGGLGIFPSDTTSRPALRPTQPPIQWVLGSLSLGAKRPSVKLTIHLHLVPRLKNVWSYTSTHPIYLHGMVLSVQGLYLYLYFYLHLHLC
jgi:hypothetical protein